MLCSALGSLSVVAEIWSRSGGGSVAMAMATALRRLAKAQGQQLHRALQQGPAAASTSFRFATSVS